MHKSKGLLVLDYTRSSAIFCQRIPKRGLRRKVALGGGDEGFLGFDEGAFDGFGLFGREAQGDVFRDFDVQAVLHRVQARALFAQEGFGPNDFLALFLQGIGFGRTGAQEEDGE